MKVNLKADDYYTQRNNTIDWSVACMPTSFAMFLRGNGVEYRNPSQFADDDYFMSLLRSPKAREICREKYPWTTNRRDGDGNALPDIPPNEVHGMYHTYLEPMVVGQRVSDFRTDMTIADVCREIAAGHVVMTAGRFPEAGIDGHAFCIVGMRDDGQLLLADPYGDFRTLYRDAHGYLIPMTGIEYDQHVQPGIQKWGHVLLEG